MVTLKDTEYLKAEKSTIKSSYLLRNHITMSCVTHRIFFKYELVYLKTSTITFFCKLLQENVYTRD